MLLKVDHVRDTRIECVRRSDGLYELEIQIDHFGPIQSDKIIIVTEHGPQGRIPLKDEIKKVKP